jgi:hypothetical protein
VAGLAFVLEALRVQCYVWVVAVSVVEPDSMVNYKPRLLVTYFTEPAVYGEPIINISLTC